MNWINLSLAVFTGVSAILTIFMYRLAKNTLKIHTFTDIIKDYSDEDLGNSVKKLWTYFKDKCNQNESELIKQYQSNYKEDSNIIHNHRKSFSLLS